MDQRTHIYLLLPGIEASLFKQSFTALGRLPYRCAKALEWTIRQTPFESLFVKVAKSFYGSNCV